VKTRLRVFAEIRRKILEFVRALGSDVEIKVKSPARHGREGRMSLMVA
jgi:hypothetical protein